MSFSRRVILFLSTSEDTENTPVNRYRILHGVCAYGIYAQVGQVSEIERVSASNE